MKRIYRTYAFLLPFSVAVAALLWFPAFVEAQSVPAAPTLNSANAVSACAVDLNWNQSNHADYFEISVNSSNPFRAGTLSGTGAHSYADPLLTPATNYSYRVRAGRTIGGTSGYSASALATTPAISTPSAAPSAFRVVGWEENGGRAVIAWTPSATPPYSGFRLYRSDDNGVTFSHVETVSLEAFQTGVQGSIAANTREDSVSTDALHIYRLRTYRTDASCNTVTGATPDGDVVSGTVPPDVKFSALSTDFVVSARPLSIRALPEPGSNGTRVKFAWDDVAREESYHFQLSDNVDFTGIGTRDRTYAAGVTETEYFTFEQNQTFYYRVRSCNAGQTICSEFRAGVPFTSSLVGPRGLAASAAPRGASTVDVTLSWEDISGELHRTRIYRKPGPAGETSFARIAELSGMGCTPTRCESYPTTYVDQSLVREDRTYEYYAAFVRVADGGEGEPSNTTLINLNLSFLDQWGWADAASYSEPPTLNWFSVPLTIPDGNLNESCQSWLARTGQAGDSGTLPRILELGTRIATDNRCAYYSPNLQELLPRISTYQNNQWRPSAGDVDTLRTQVARGSTPGPVFPIGLGWVRTAWNAIRSSWGDAVNAPDESATPYAVSVSPSGVIGGYAWTSNGGWLSFNDSDVQGCPQIPAAEASCEARVNVSTGAVTGWAKFVKWGDSGWVSLSRKASESAYGLSYDDINRRFVGEAWGGNVTGWLTFAGLAGPTLYDPESPTTESLTLRWDNPVDYDSVAISYKPSLEPSFYQSFTDTPASAGNDKMVTIPNLSAGTSYDFYLEATKGPETAISERVSGSTIATRTGYTFICRATSESNIALSWVGDLPNAPALTLYTSDTDSGIRGGSRTVLAPPPPLSRTSGAMDHRNLVPGSTHYYWLEAGGTFYPTDPVSCTTLATIPQDPDGLNVTPLGPRSLYVTWKDNATRAHNFVLERIKVTPATSTNVLATRDSVNINLTLANPTNTDDFRSPYYHVIERSAEGDPQVRFTANDNTSTTFRTAFGEDMAFTGTRTSYDFVDVDVPQGTYYYRVKACSLLKVNYTGDSAVDDVCAPATYANNGNPIIISGTRSVAASVLDSLKRLFPRLFGNVSAQVETVEGAQIDLNTYFSQFRTGENGVPALTFAANPGVYRDNNLEPDTVYLYRTKTVYTDATGGETSYTNEGAGKTLNVNAATPQNVRVCVRNNLCGTAAGLRGGGETPANQCTTNNDCRNVGTTRQFFEER